MAREQIFLRAAEKKIEIFDAIGHELAAEANVAVGDPPFYKGDGTLNRSEVLRRLLAKADRRLRDL